MAGFMVNCIKRKNFVTGVSSGPPDYREYHMSGREYLMGTVAGIVLIILLSYIFYRSLFAIIFLCPLVPFCVKVQKERLCRKRKDALKIQFKDALQSISAALQAGYSMENAIREATEDIRNMYGSEGLMTRELRAITEGIRNSRTPEELFLSLANRSGLEDISDFAEVFMIAKRSGGDLPAVIRVCSMTIGDKVETAKEIQTLVAAKKLEGRMMDIIPCFIILYVDISSPGFFDILYHTVLGRVVMTICLLVYAGAILLSEKIMSIEV